MRVECVTPEVRAKRHTEIRMGPRFGRRVGIKANPSRHGLIVTVTKSGRGYGGDDQHCEGRFHCFTSRIFACGHPHPASRSSVQPNTRVHSTGWGSGGDQDPSQVSVRIPCRTPTLPCRRIRTSQGGRRLPATVVPYMQCMPCNARIACMARATRMPRNASVTCSDRKAILPRKIASTCENQISGSDAPQHCGTHDRATRPQACERVGIRDGSFRRDYAPRRPLFTGLGGFSPSKAGVECNA